MDGMKKAAEVLAPYLRNTKNLPPICGDDPSTRPVYKCQKCHDLEWLHPTGVDGRPCYNQAVPCECLKSRLQQKIASPEYQRERGGRASQTFDNFEVNIRGGNRDARDAAKAWTTANADFIWLLVYGGTGNGKSHLCNAALAELLKRSIGAKLVTASRILSELRVGMSDHTTDAVMAEYQQIAALIVDDIGAGMKHPSEKGSEWEWARIEELLVFRYENVMPTFCTTNLQPSDLPERILSRFKDGELSRIVHNAAGDHRETK